MIVLRTDIHFMPEPTDGAVLINSATKPVFHYNHEDWECKIEFPDVEIVQPGDWAFGIVRLGPIDSDLLHCRIGPGSEFELHLRGTAIANGIVTAVIEDS